MQPNTQQDTATVNITLHTTVDAFDALRPEWNELLARSAIDTVFSTWEWQSHWWNAYQPGELLIVAARTPDGRLVGLAPWFIETKAKGERVLRGIGCVDVTDYVDTIVDRDCQVEVYTQFARCLVDNRALYDRINLCNLPAHSPTLNLFIDILTQHGFAAERAPQEVCPVICLPDTWDAYLSRLDKKERHELRRKLRRADGAGTVENYTVGDDHNLAAELETFLSMMAESAPYKKEFLADARNDAFFRSVMPVMYACGWLKLHFLKINGEYAATYLNLDYHKRALVYNSGLRQKFMEYSPGIVLLAENIREAIEQGYELFDFLRGNEDYKYRMGGENTEIFMLKAKLTE